MTTNLTAAINGTWTPGTVPALTPETYLPAQEAASSAVRTMLGLTARSVGFYIVATPRPGGQVHRSRWKVVADASGPTLRTGTTAPHDSQVWLTLQLYPLSEVRQVTFDPDVTDDMPYNAVLAPVVSALILRRLWGPDARTVEVMGYGTGTFAPSELAFDDLHPPTPITAAYDTVGLASYAFVLPEGSSDSPSMWLSAEEDAWKVSYSVDGYGKTYVDRWDDPVEQAPAFDPLPEPGSD